MTWVPSFEIGILNGWLFMMLYPLQWLAVVIAPRRIAERTGHPPELKKDRQGRLWGSVTQILWIGATLYSIFLPLRVGTAWFYAGLGIFALGVLVLVAATAAVIRSKSGEPFSRGIYRYSRHPMYLSMILVYSGVTIAAASWLFLLITFITFFLQRFQAIQEERYCCGRFGAAYVDYMAATRRWFGKRRRAGLERGG